MATYRLQRWSVGYYSATTMRPAYADVILDGIASRGFLRRRAVQHAEQLRVMLLPTDSVDAKGSQAIVKRAMVQSADKWRGKR